METKSATEMRLRRRALHLAVVSLFLVVSLLILAQIRPLVSSPESVDAQSADTTKPELKSVDDNHRQDAGQHFHDFGVVPAHALLQHEFSVVNDTDHIWQLREIKTTCRCTAAGPVKTRIRPSESLILPVTVKIESDNGRRIVQAVRVFFKNDADNQRFLLSATVRDHVYVSPAEIRVSLVGGESIDRTLVVENYSESDWTGLSTSPVSLGGGADGSRLTVVGITQKPVQPHRNTHAARQVWTVDLQFDSDGLPPGLHEFQLNLAADPLAGEPELKQVRFIATVNPEVRAVPSTLVFLRNEAGSQKRALLKFATSDLVPDPDAIVASHDLPIDLQFQFDVLMKDTISMTVTVGEATENIQAMKGSIDIRWPQPAECQMAIPVTVLGRTER